MIEYEPNGFAFIRVQDEPPFFTSCFYANRSMYMTGVYYGEENPWTPYLRNENSPYLPSLIEGTSTVRTGEVILDENGEMSIYYKSPYYVTGNLSERKYLLTTNRSSEYICAIKKENKFVNLISGLEFESAEEYLYEENATLDVSFYADRRFDL